MPKIIGIDFPDNDFYYTVQAFLQMLVFGAKNDGKSIDVSKEQVVEMFNRSAAGLYWVAQNRLAYRKDWDPTEYLKIDEKHVFFDEEVAAHIRDCGGGVNGEFHVVDLQQYCVKPYYYCV